MENRVCCPKDEETRREWEESLIAERAELPPHEILERMQKFFATLSHPIRLKIAFHLLLKDYCVCELIFMLGLEGNLVSYHLREMRKARIVSAYMKSGWKYYRLNDNVKCLLSQKTFISPFPEDKI